MGGGSLVMFPDRPQPQPSRPELLRKSKRMEVLRSRRKLLRSRKKLLRRRKKLLRRRRKRRRKLSLNHRRSPTPRLMMKDWTVVSDKKAAEDSTPESLYPDLTETPSAPPT